MPVIKSAEAIEAGGLIEVVGLTVEENIGVVASCIRPDVAYEF